MKKVFLISTSLEEDTKAKSLPDDENSYSLGLGYLHSVIEQAGYNIRTKNYNTADENMATRDIISNLNGFEPDYLLMQVFSMNRVTTYKIIELAKKINKRIKIIVGGVHATILYHQLLEHFDIDYVVLGEGEETIIELLNALDNNDDVSSINGIAYKMDNNIIKNADRELIQDLDKLPFPKHELFITPKRKMACILTSRGCPFKCSFCCLHSITKRIYRMRSVDNIIGEVEYTVRNFKNIRLIQIADDTFTLNQQRVMDFCKEVTKRKFEVNFNCIARFKPASEEMFELMEKAGFVDIGFGLETGSEKLLHSIHKNITQDDVRETFKALKNTKIKVTNLLMIGFPGETHETVNETINFLKELRKIRPYKTPSANILWVYPNTEVYDIMKERGAIDESYWLTDKSVPYFTLEHSYEELQRMSFRISLAAPLKSRLYYILKMTMHFLRNPISTANKILKTKVYKEVLTIFTR